MGSNSSKRGKTFKYHLSSSGKSGDLQNEVREILKDEYNLRRVVQLEESLNHRIRARKKEAELESNAVQLKEPYETELETARSDYLCAKIKLYTDEITLPPDLKDLYDSLRRNPKWYMRQGLVENCIAQDGCCSRDCGCCEKRSLSDKKGRGHCTLNCWCCSAHRGHDALAEKSATPNSQLNDLFSNLEYLERMGNWLFDPLTPGKLKLRN